MVKKKKTLKRKTKKTVKRSHTTELGSAMIKQMLGKQGGGFSGGQGMNLQGMMSGMSGGGYGGPGTHAPVKASGAAVGKMADGRLIHLKGPKMGQMV